MTADEDLSCRALFSQMERQYNRRLAEKLKALLPQCEIVLPQDFRAGTRGSFNDRRHLARVFGAASRNSPGRRGAGAHGRRRRRQRLAFETGYARGLGKPVLGVRTDYRQSQVKGLNLMLAAGASEILCHFSFNEQLDDLAGLIVAHLERLAQNRFEARRAARAGSPFPALACARRFLIRCI